MNSVTMSRAMVGYVCFLLLFFGVTSPIVGAVSTDNSQRGSLQRFIDAASPGDTVIIPAGQYVGPVIIRKAMTLQADQGATLFTPSGTSAPAVTVQADGVRIVGLHIVQPNDDEYSTAVLLEKVNATVLRNLHIETNSFGILLREANQSNITHNNIEWLNRESSAKQATKKNGIDLFKANDNVIDSNKITAMHDGIYVESSHRNTLTHNSIFHSRYGIHTMYSQQPVIRYNLGEYNVTGAMVMGVQGAVVEQNTFRKQSENVNSQGILLFDVQKSYVRHNVVDGNRVGLYIEQSSHNYITHNEVIRNFVGVQWLESANNQFTQNDFVANVIAAEVDEQAGNTMKHNYWDAFQGIDVDGDRISNTSFAISPFFQRVTKQVPAFQLFFQSPSMLFLESMMTLDQSSWMKDEAPLMQPVGRTSVASSTSTVWTMALWLSLMMLMVSLIYYLGVKR